MKVLVACEVSGIVRDAFRSKGHQAFSCDILESDSPYHLTGDALDIAYTADWDLMICHPPCTHLATSGARWFKEKIANGSQEAAIDFAKKLWGAPVNKIALENPVSVLSSYLGKPNQIIQPWQFGHEYQKKTCLWLKNLDPLEPTKIVPRGEFVRTKSGKNLPRWYSEAPKKDRGAHRSVTFKGIATAMADQWTT